MTKKNTVVFIVFTLISVAFNFMFAGSFSAFFSTEFVMIASVCVVAATCTLPFIAICAAINVLGAFAGGGVQGLILALVSVMFAVLAGLNIKNKVTTGKLVLTIAAGIFLSAVLFVVYTTNKSGVQLVENFLSIAKTDFINIATQQIRLMTNENMDADVIKIADTYFMYVQNTIPSILIIVSLILAFFSACAVSFVLRLLKMRDLYRVKFSELMCDRTTSFVFAISAVFVLFMKQSMFQTVFLNVFIILLFVFQICGLSILDSILKKKKILSGFRFLIMVVSAFFLTSGIPVIILIGAAIMDSFKNFRAIGVEKSDTDSDDTDEGSE